MDAWDSAAILRRCGRCCEWLRVSEYDGTARLCKWCMFTEAPKLIGQNRCRNIVITESGRALLREIRAEEAGAAA